jgi:endonuclease YncB( thermonuclease family)
LAVFAALALAGCEAGAADTPEDGAAEPAGVSESFLAQSAGVERGAVFACTPVKLWDGDGPIHCAEGPRIRLSGLAARETDGSCRPGHPCPSASAEAARDTLASLLGRTTGTAREGHLLIEGPALTCRAVGSAGGNRTAAWCVSPTKGDLSCAMVASGTVEKWDRYWGNHACG